MWIIKTKLEGCYIIEPDVYKDDRGLFMETYNVANYKSHEGLGTDFVQDNVSISKANVLRGLHFQNGIYAQAKLVTVLRGSALDVVVDLRPDSPTYGEHVRIHLSEMSGKQVFVPRGFAHGFLSLEDDTIFSYKCDNFYFKDEESGIIFNDRDLNIDWTIPHGNMIINEKDLELPNFKDLKL